VLLKKTFEDATGDRNRMYFPPFQSFIFNADR